MFVDSHCHLQPFKPEKLSQTLQEARQAGVEALLSMGQNLDISAQTVHLHERESSVWAGIGIHPWQAVPVDAEARERLMDLAEREGVVAIGEVGLDFERVSDGTAHETQVQALVAQLRLARELGLPLSLHCRGAHPQMLALLDKEGMGVRGVIHSFAGNADQMKRWLDRGFYVGVGYRALVRPGKEEARELALQIPLDRLLLETDASYSSAWGDSGEKLTPGHVKLVAETLAADRGTTAEALGTATTANARRLFRLPAGE
ncbi:MAG: TatD family hydrolase [Chloroflexi bacterium]|nr:TatD family hydrolase [Chloroflexota bacterium]